jgi:membrane protease YdiL (CAAX protease family)
MRTITAIIVGSIVFGCLMALRAEASNSWVRALIAGAAGAVLGALIARKTQRKGS